MLIKDTVRIYLMQELIVDNDDLKITDDMALISGGLIDSLTTLQLVDFIERQFSIEFTAHEVDRENLDTLLKIEDFVQSKMK